MGTVTFYMLANTNYFGNRVTRGDRSNRWRQRDFHFLCDLHVNIGFCHLNVNIDNYGIQAILLAMVTFDNIFS